MPDCALCRETVADHEISRFSGHDFCAPCQVRDPADALKQHHQISAVWQLNMQWYSGTLGLPDQDPDFAMSCDPEWLAYKVIKMVRRDVEAGDSVFDSKIWVSTDDRPQAAEVIASEGVQSAVLALLSDVRPNEMGRNHITLKGATLEVSVRPRGGLSDARVQEIQLESAALALHLRYRKTS